MLYVTHNQSEARIIADKINNELKTYAGRGFRKKLPTSLLTVQVASFVGFENMLNGRGISADRGLLKIEAGKIITHASRTLRLGGRYVPSEA